jgi:hypothetical protein
MREWKGFGEGKEGEAIAENLQKKEGGEGKWRRKQ